MNSQTGANPNPQYATHPDAESLNAFAEQAQGAAERGQVVAHLAVCRRCRQVVALAQQAAGIDGGMAPAQPAVAPVRQSPVPTAWPRNWRWAWAPAMALVGLMAVAIVVEVRRSDERGKLTELAKAARPAAPQQLAEAHQPAQPESTLRKETAAPATAGSAARKQRAKTGAEQPSPEEMASAAFSSQGGAGLAANGMVGVEQGSTSEAPSSEPPPVVSYNANEGAAWRQQEPVPSAVARKAMAPNEAQAWDQAPAGGASNRAMAPQAPGAAQPPAPKVFAARRSRAVPLPSGLEAVSTATNGRETVAIDSAGTVFVSQEVGPQWQPVAQQWSGRAVRVATDVIVVQGGPAQAKANTQADAGAASDAGRVFELFNDQKLVWISTDGASWSPR